MILVTISLIKITIAFINKMNNGYNLSLCILNLITKLNIREVDLIGVVNYLNQAFLVNFTIVERRCNNTFFLGNLCTY